MLLPHLIGGITTFSHISSFIRNFLLLYRKLSYWFCFTIPQGLLYPSNLLYLVVRLWSSAQGYLVDPHTRTYMAQPRGFAVEGPSNWNKLPQSLRDFFPISSDHFHKHL